MNTRKTVSSGNSQSPLNFVLRRITSSKRFDDTEKAHLHQVILELKKQYEGDLGQNILAAQAAWSYAQALRIRTLLDNAAANSKEYRLATYVYCRYSEQLKKQVQVMQMQGPGGQRRQRQQRTMERSALWSSQQTGPGVSEVDAVTA